MAARTAAVDQQEPGQARSAPLELVFGELGRFGGEAIAVHGAGEEGKQLLAHRTSRRPPAVEREQHATARAGGGPREAEQEAAGVRARLTEQTNVRSLIRALRVRLGNWQSVERALPLFHGMRVDVMAGRYEVSASVAFRVAKVPDVSLHDVLDGTALPPGGCKHCGRPGARHPAGRRTPLTRQREPADRRPAIAWLCSRPHT